ncbi:MAG: DNA polymerase III subunit epsilon [Salinicola sp.]|uniref:3'-5' exonuclease n=1 Tax=Salinicola sp. TaxID=1978524 RepID=UPI000C90BB77|nr:3'-5' exonuclease [Salinicola sp.]MAM57004.1 DNA polymerase III subunit epsilon [Salinicola sp.]NRB55923.1 3'-5' exonuclease [Salinicola sp.]
MIRSLRRAADRRRQGHGRYDWLFSPYLGDELVAIDCETTGLDTRTAELVSIAAVRLEGERVMTSGSLDLRLRPPASLRGDSIKIHRLRGVDLNDGDELGDALEKFLDFIGNRPLLGWCIDYDLAVIDRQLRPLFDFGLPNPCVDVARLYRREMHRMRPQLEPAMSFERVAETLEVPVMGRHTALGDAVTTALMYIRLKQGALAAG